MKINSALDLETLEAARTLPAGSVVEGSQGDEDSNAVGHAFVRTTGGWVRTTELGGRPGGLPTGVSRWTVLHTPPERAR